jgi:hypothetical protein
MTPRLLNSVLEPEYTALQQLSLYADSTIQNVEAQTSKIHHHWQGPYNPTTDARALLFEVIDVFQFSILWKQLVWY